MTHQFYSLISTQGPQKTILKAIYVRCNAIHDSQDTETTRVQE